MTYFSFITQIYAVDIERYLRKKKKKRKEFENSFDSLLRSRMTNDARLTTTLKRKCRIFRVHAGGSRVGISAVCNLNNLG